VAVILLLLFLLRPGASRLKSRIAGSISAAVARPVEIGSVHIRLLPQPGFDLENLVVYDDPAFGAEPMLRAGEVTAILRLTSLARGRLEIARLELTEPSLNLVRGENGRWNLETLLERAAQTPLAPTATTKSGPRPGFPYIEASSGRINFKNGQEKKAYALINADFALWQDSENTWGVRLKAQPFRSDMNLSDTGIVRVNGRWQRASNAREMPIEFSLEWDRPQLGQLTKFFTGGDKGWRGAVLLDATLTGTPAKLQVSAEASIRDFRRYDVSSGDSLRLAGHCDAQYSSIDHEFHELFCRAPAGDGALTLHGSVGLPGSHVYDLTAVGENLPASALVALAKHTRKNLPEDLSAAGSVEGSFSLRRSGTSADLQLAGRGEIGGLRIFSAKSKTQIAPGDVPFVLTSKEPEHKSSSGKRAVLKDSRLVASGPHLEFGPVAAGTGRPTPATARGWVNRSGYRVSLAGDMEVARVLEIARLFGVPALAASADGMAQVDLQVAGSWPGQASSFASDSSQPQVTGTAKLRNVRAELRGMEGPIEISAAELQLLPEEVRVARLTASAAHTMWTGSLALPRGCGTPGACLLHFNLNTNEIGLSELGRWVNPHPKNQPWYRALTSTAQAQPSLLANLHASGKVTANRLLIRDLTATHVSANINLENGKLRISELLGDVLGGEHHGDWNVDFSVKPAAYSGSGTFTGISLGRVADAMRDKWIAGTAAGSYKVTATGSSAPEFWQSADGTLEFEMQAGMLAHILLVSDAGALRVERFEGRARLRDGTLEIKNGRLDSPFGVFGVNGTASLQRELDIKLTRSPMASAARRSHGYTITGTVAEPQVVQIASPETQARLKP
jgi:uncharacterized protein involved in outer membrane biogenesis